MAVPVVGSNVVSIGSVGAGTTLAIVLTAVVPIGDVLAIAVATSTSQTLTATDSKSNVYVNETGILGINPSYSLLTTKVTKALAIADTITITIGASVQGAAAAMIQLTGVPQNQIGVGSYAQVGTNKTAASTAASSNALVTTNPDDCVFLFLVATINSGALLATDFTLGSVDSSYTRADSTVSSGGTTNVGICLCYKTVTATPPSQSPTFTLNASRTWVTDIVMLSGVTARGAICNWLRMCDSISNSTNWGPVPISPYQGVPTVKYGQIVKSIDDGFPNQVISPQEPRVGIQVSDGLLVSD